MCIFARCLSDVLDAKGKRIGSLHNVVVDTRRIPPLRIPPLQIMRLQQAANGDCDLSVTLSPDQLEAVRNKFSLNDEDMRFLKTALLAESTVRILLNRIPTDQAVKIGNGVFRMLLDADPETLDAYDVDIGGVRGDIDDEMFEEMTPLAVLDQRYHSDLEPVAQAYDEAVLWLNHAYGTGHSNPKRMYAELASSLLVAAGTFLANLSLPAEAAPLIEEWKDFLEQTQREAAQIAHGDAEQP
jgi:hypothetical protein